MPAAASALRQDERRAVTASQTAPVPSSPTTNASSPLKLGPRYAGKLVTVVIEDTHFRILHGDEELAIKPRRNPAPITRLHVRGKGTHLS